MKKRLFLFWANFIRQSDTLIIDGLEVNCDCIEFNGHIVGVPMKPGKKEIESDDEVVVLAADLDGAMRLFIRKAKERLGKKKGIIVQREISPWVIMQFPFCPHIQMEGTVPRCSFPKQDSVCAIMVQKGAAKDIDYPPGCVVCKMFAAYHEESHEKNGIKVVMIERPDGIKHKVVA